MLKRIKITSNKLEGLEETGNGIHDLVNRGKMIINVLNEVKEKKARMN